MKKPTKPKAKAQPAFRQATPPAKEPKYFSFLIRQSDDETRLILNGLPVGRINDHGTFTPHKGGLTIDHILGNESGFTRVEFENLISRAVLVACATAATAKVASARSGKPC